jgi:MFS family permease
VIRLRRIADTTFRSLHIRNYRLYFIGQTISVSGTWMQSVALAWLVVHYLAPKSERGVDVGITLALQFLPMLLLGAWGGLVADRVDKRRLLVATQISAGVLALALGILVLSGPGPAGHAHLWEVYILSLLLGVVNMFDNPARQTFVMEMVGRDDLPNAVSLNSVVMNASRVVGPAIGGLVIVLFSISVCFFVNAVSYVAVLVGLSLMRTADLHRTPPVAKARGQIRDGLRYVWRTPPLRNTLIAMAVIGIFAYNFTVTLALLAKTTFHGGAGTYSLLTSCMGVGAIIGGLLAAHRAKPTRRLLHTLALVFGALLVGVAFAPSLALAMVLIVFMGAASIGFIATANATLQLQAEPAMRGRVMSLYAMAFLGSTPIGAPLVGAIAEWSNPRISMAVGGAATVLAAGVLSWRHLAGQSDTRVPDDVSRAAEVRAVIEVESTVARPA